MSHDYSVAQIAVVVVTYEPDNDVVTRLTAMRAQGGTMVIVDNSRDPENRARVQAAASSQRATLLANPDNPGLAFALNQGIQHAMQEGCEWLLLFDQDSTPSADLSAQLLATLHRHPQRENIAIVGANIIETGVVGLSHRWLQPHPWISGGFTKTPIRDVDLPSVTMVITSGSLLRADDFRRIGPMEERFFIDAIDTDFCLRCRAANRLIAVSALARLQHAFGARNARSFLGFRLHPTNHSALRHYYMTRNRVLMFWRHAWRFPHWAVFECAAALLMLYRVITVESERLRKLRAITSGYLDGIRGRFGRCPPERVR